MLCAANPPCPSNGVPSPCLPDSNDTTISPPRLTSVRLSPDAASQAAKAPRIACCASAQSSDWGQLAIRYVRLDFSQRGGCASAAPFASVPIVIPGGCSAYARAALISPNMMTDNPTSAAAAPVSSGRCLLFGSTQPPVL